MLKEHKNGFHPSTKVKQRTFGKMKRVPLANLEVYREIYGLEFQVRCYQIGQDVPWESFRL